jgi:hypothetical protein
VGSPAGWYPQPDGRQRYWDGEVWTANFVPGVPAETIALPVLNTEHPAAFSGRKVSKAALFGWGGLAFVVLMGALGSGFSGAVGALGVFALAVGVIALARGRVGWARLGSRAAGGVAIAAALALLIVGGITAPPSMAPASELTTASSDTPATTDPAAEAAATASAQAAAAETAAAEVAATEAAAAAEKAAADAKAKAKATADAAAAKVAADATAAKAAKAAATKKAQAVAAASAKAKAAAPAAVAPAPKPVPIPVAPAPSAKQYANCTAMHVDYKGGVARPGAVDQRASGHAKYAPVYSAALYDANSGSDRDNDGIACEQ